MVLGGTFTAARLTLRVMYQRISRGCGTAIAVAMAATFFVASAADAPPLFPEPMNSGEIQLALQKLNVLGRVLYLAAHPDDENPNLMALWANGSLYETAYLSLTRGDGGQNLIGPELRERLGIIRTEELLAARRLDHAQQFFSPAVDFGFSKTAEETLPLWYGVSGAGGIRGCERSESFSGATCFRKPLAPDPASLEHIAIFFLEPEPAVRSSRPNNPGSRRLQSPSGQSLHGNRRGQSEHAQEPGRRQPAAARRAKRIFQTIRRPAHDERAFRRCRRYKLVAGRKFGIGCRKDSSDHFGV